MDGVNAQMQKMLMLQKYAAMPTVTAAQRKAGTLRPAPAPEPPSPQEQEEERRAQLAAMMDDPATTLQDYLKHVSPGDIGPATRDFIERRQQHRRLDALVTELEKLEAEINQGRTDHD